MGELQTVEGALTELRKMALAARVTMNVETYRRAEWMITINGYIGHFQGSTLEDCMSQVSKWAASAKLKGVKGDERTLENEAT